MSEMASYFGGGDYQSHLSAATGASNRSMAVAKEEDGSIKS